MSNKEQIPLRVLAVAGSLSRDSSTRVVVGELARQLAERGCVVDLLDLLAEAIPLYNPDTAAESKTFAALQKRVDRADILILGTPDYHGCISSSLKSFLDHFWREFAGKLFVTVVASHEKGLTVTDQLRTLARQCYAWSLPYGISFLGEEDVKDTKEFSPALAKRLSMAAADASTYGRLLAEQRRADLASSEPGFLARHRKNS
jgi:FMN reductase